MNRRFALVAVLSVLSASCALGDSLSLEVLDDDPRFSRINARLPVTVRPETATVFCSGNSCTAAEFVDLVRQGCTQTLAANGRTTSAATCGTAVITSDQEMCVAHLLLTVVEAAAPVRMLLRNAGNTLNSQTLVPPQDSETNAVLAAEAATIAAFVLTTIGDALLVGANCADAHLTASAGTASSFTSPAPPLTVADELARFYVEALNVLDDAAALSRQHGSAVSEAELSRSVDTSEGALQAFAPAASRAAVAHHLVGGAHGFPAFFPNLSTASSWSSAADASDGFFTRRPPRGEARAALDLLRTAAPAPSLIMGSTTIDELVQGGGAVGANGSVRERIGLYRGRRALYASASASATYGLLGVSRDSFVEARDYLREELRAFDRSASTTVLPAERLANGGLTSAATTNGTTSAPIVLYAATRNPPVQLLPSYWAAALRFDPSPAPLAAGLTTYTSPPTWDWRPLASGALPAGHSWGDEVAVGTTGTVASTSRRTVASALGDAVGRGPEMITRLCQSVPSTCAVSAPLLRARDVLERALSRFGGAPPLGAGTTPVLTYDTATSLGRARACTYATSASTFDVRVDLLTSIPTADLIIVRGREGLECAVRGNVDGVPCSQTFFDNADETGPFAASGGAGEVTQRVVNLLLGQPNANATALFVVRLRTGSVARRPGSYDEVTGFVLPKPSGSAGYQYCTTFPILPLIEREAASVFAPDPNGEPGAQEYCAGVRRDLRIPLENELTSDGTPEESSWRHYLELAQRAAAESDALGEDLVRTGLEMDIRAEAASDELTRLCGVRINLSSVTRALSGGDSGFPAVHPTIVPPNCAAPYVASGVDTGSRCILDPVLYAASRSASDEDMARLASCVGANVVPWTALGNRVLCMWDQTPDAGGNVTPSDGICGGATRDRPCPYPSDRGTNLCAPPPNSWAPITVPDFMGIFAFPPDPPPDPPRDPQDLPCDALARLRAGTATPADRDALSETPVLTYETISWLASRLSWEPSVGDFSTVRFGGAQVFSTGTFAGPGTSWPMGPRPANPSSECPVGSPPTSPAYWTGPLFCIQNLAGTATGPSGTARAIRSQMNDMMARAVFALRWWAGLDLSGSSVPFYPSRHYHQFYPSTGYTWMPIAGSTASCAADGNITRDDRNGDTDGAGDLPMTNFAARACVLDTSPRGVAGACPVTGVPAFAEWSRCSYDRADCRIFANETLAEGDCDDPPAPTNPTQIEEVWRTYPGRDFNLPMLIRPEDATTSTPEARRFAAALWEDDSVTGLPWLFESASSRTADQLQRELPLELDPVLPPHWSGNLAQPCYNNCTSSAYCWSDSFFGNYTYADFLNGVELGCVAARDGLPTTATNCTEPVGVLTLADALASASYFECRANEISMRNARMVIRDLPRRVVDVLAEDGNGVYGAGAGEVDAEVSEIRAAILELSMAQSAMAGDIRSVAAALRRLRAGVATSERQREIESLTALSTTFDRVTQCVTAVASIASTDSATAVGNGFAAAATCLNSVGQIIIASQIEQLRSANVDDSLIQQFADFDSLAGSIGGTLEGRVRTVLASMERIDAAVARLRANQMEAREALARALGLSDAGATSHNAVNAVYRARFNTLSIRYGNAHRRAVRSAYIARIALEQRLGMSLADMDDDLFSDEAPREWVDTLCTLPSIDYDALRGTPGATGSRDADPGLIAPDNYAGTFVGDYVRRLEDVFESYSFVHPFQAGTDVAVISMRDDILHTRGECEVPSPNLLLNGGRLDRRLSSERGGWDIVGCTPGAVADTVPPAARENRSCVVIEPMPGTRSALTGGATPTGTILASETSDTPPPFRVSFGGSPAWTASARLRQTVHVLPGRHRLSWFSGGGPPTSVQMIGAGVTSVSATVFNENIEGISPWKRNWRFYDVAAETDVNVEIGGAGSTSSSVSIILTGLMLEDIRDVPSTSPDALVTNPSSALPPAPSGAATIAFGMIARPADYIESGDDGLRTVRDCRDSDGHFFRAEAFTPGCVRTCADGYDGLCPPEYAEVRCYRQAAFALSADDLQRTLVDGDAGFASGNYNYRIDSVAVNLVGTGLRDCEAGGGSSGCYASGTFSYSLLHGGPYFVRNALGTIYEAPIFPGRIESARALAAERYLTNPLSASDSGLLGGMTPFTRNELRGRPLNGAMLLRIWDDPRFVFENLEDIQIVLTYRYWTHQR